MNGSQIAQLVILVLLLCLSAFFSSAETAFTTVNKIYMRTLAQDGNTRAERVLQITENSGKMLSAILIGNNVVNLSASSLATTLAIGIFGSVGAGIATGVLTLLILIFGEISPKTIATLRADKLALKYCSAIWWLMFVLTPVIFVVNLLSQWFLRLLGVRPGEEIRSMTEEELRTIVDVGQESGVIEDKERDMIHNLFDFGDDKAKEVMVPRIDMCFIDADSSYDEMLSIYRDSYFSRLPVYEESTDNVIGILNMKDVLAYEGAKEDFSIRAIMREPFFTYEYKNTYELFMEMKENAVNLAIVLDEYGVTAGLITMEDLLEEIVGEIRDEYDTDEEEDYEIIKEGEEYRVSGSMNLDDFCELIGVDYESEDSDTLGGFLLELLEHFPEEGECYETKEGVRFQILSMDKKRIETVLVTRVNNSVEETENRKRPGDRMEPVRTV
ncbi:MAG: hemolysin family protein [bacterium]|nr:hemolysin family protein [bacterium]MDY4101149.1 hemolysin family protein [Lachnospiraceae bacterium]